MQSNAYRSALRKLQTWVRHDAGQIVSSEPTGQETHEAPGRHQTLILDFGFCHGTDAAAVVVPCMPAQSCGRGHADRRAAHSRELVTIFPFIAHADGDVGASCVENRS